jgi:hypothetical protein
VSVAELPDGYAFTVPASSEALRRMAELVDLERQCCAFLTFMIVVENAYIRLEVTGPGEVKKAIANYFSTT